MRLYRFLFRISKPIHKYLGLVFCLYFLAMGLSGLLLNNPGWIKSVSAPWALTPENYEPHNWNRMYLRGGTIKGDEWFLAGKPGVIYSPDGGESFAILDEGFAPSVYGRDTHSLLVQSNSNGTELYAATRSGLYHQEFSSPWSQIDLPGSSGGPVVDVLQTRAGLVALGESEVFLATDGQDEFAPVALRVESEDALRSVPLFRVLHDIHNGKILGTPGKYLIDVVALGLIFLSLSALVIWYVPWRNRRIKKWFQRPSSIFRLGWKYHLKIGIWSAVFLVALAITGALLRPPLLIAIAPYSVESSSPLLTFSQRTDGLGGKIRKGVYASRDDSIILATDGGFFRGPADFSQPLRPWHIPVPVHSMGVTVLEEIEPGAYLVGSFMGLYIWNELSAQLWRLPRLGLQEGNPYRSNDLLSAVVMEGSVPRYRVDYHDGMMPVFAKAQSFVPEMPAQIVERTPLSLWHYFFEFHNGRLFEKWLGSSYMLTHI
ncbi:PepSY domain-containing protein [Desulfurispira natronophila]|uniref:PepSY domain-containing protein n=1 Tax=Desulfurispira natronophila TaxID=682562 RepID=A0A7W8DHD7_9BACT|nr:PepSY domain-containing protein [Desulfurispira natronophila]MBB5022319.1 hypothetical protein [Desulfurispira natronophila]